METKEAAISDDSAVELTEQEEIDVEDHVAQRSPVIFEIIRRSGEEELSRPWLSLVFSGLAAGLSMGFSVLTQAFLHRFLPAGQSSVLIEKVGYSVGFVMVILAHQQLFTETTLTAVVPFMASLTFPNFRRVLRIWTLVFLANLVGTALFSIFFLKSGIVEPEIIKNIHDVSFESMRLDVNQFFIRGIGAGFLIASLVWILANVDNAKLILIVLVTYLVALFQFSHVIAGSAEAAFLVFDGTISFFGYLRFLIPTLFGNIAGGSALFALLAYGQIRLELREHAAEEANKSKSRKKVAKKA